MKGSRQKQIVDMLVKNGSVKISELLRIFSVSIETIRRDLSALERSGMLIKNYGGAVLAAHPHSETEVAGWFERQSTAIKEKDLIGKRAASYIPDGSVIALEVGTTMLALAKHLERHKKLTILTNDIIVAQALWQHHGKNVVLIGGKMGAGYYTCGELSRGVITEFASIDIFLMSTEGLTISEGLSTPNCEVNAIKKIFLQKASKVIALCDHTKFGRKGIYHTCHLDRLDLLITDPKTPTTILDKIREKDIDIDIISYEE